MKFKTTMLIVMFLISIIFLSVAEAYTKSTEFYETKEPENKRQERTITAPKGEGPRKGVGISIREYAPKDPRFTKYEEPIVFPTIPVTRVAFSKIQNQESAEEPKKENTEPEETPEEARERMMKEIFEKQVEKNKQEKIMQEIKEKQEKRKNTKQAVLSVKTKKVKNNLANPQIGILISMTIIFIGLVIYFVLFILMKKTETPKSL